MRLRSLKRKAVKRGCQRRWGWACLNRACAQPGQSPAALEPAHKQLPVTFDSDVWFGSATDFEDYIATLIICSVRAAGRWSPLLDIAS